MPHGPRGSAAQDLVARGQQRILQLMAKGVPPAEALAEICRLLDQHNAGAWSCILAADPEARFLSFAAGPGLPDALLGVLAGSGNLADTEAFGTAALLAGRAWESSDLGADPSWGDHRAPCQEAGLGAWTAIPVLGPERQVLGALALGRPDPGAFPEAQLGLLRSCAGLASLAFQRMRQERALSQSERLARSILECAPIGIQVFDADGNSMAVNPARVGPGLRSDGPDHSFNVLQDPESVVSGLAGLYAAAYRGEVVDRPVVELRPAGPGSEEAHYHQMLYPVLDEQGQVAAVVSMSMDVTQQVQAERALRREKARFEALVQNALDLIFTLDAKGRVSYVSPSIRVILGYDPQEVLGRTALRLIHPLDRAMVGRGVANLAMTGARELVVEIRLRHKEGGFRWLLVRGSNQLGNPAVEGLVFNSSDITELKAMSDEVLQREQKLQLVLNSTEDGTWDWNLVTGAVDHNEQWQRVTGDPGTGRHQVQEWAARVHPADLARVTAALNAHFMGTTEQYLVEYRLLHHNGNWIWILDRGKVVARDPEGRPLRLAGTIADVTTRKEAELALQASEERMRAVVSALPDTFLRLDARGCLLDAEIHALPTVGGEALRVDRPLKEAPLDPALVQALLKGAAEVRESGRRKEFRHAVPDHGGERHFDVRIQPGGGGEALCLLRDITEQHRTEEYLHQTQKLESLGILAGGIAHDFNNLFQGLVGNLNLAEMQVGEQSPVLPVLRRMEGIVHRAAELTKRLLHYSGKGFFLVRLTNLSQALMDMSEMLRVTVPRNVTLRLDLAPDLPSVEVDQDQLHQVVLNLVTNALEAMDALEGGELPEGGRGGTITLSTRTEVVPEAPREGFALEPAMAGLHAVIEVRDDGPGMNATQLAHCFDPFYTTKHPGRGLGLPATLGILRRHKGGIQVSSLPGQGSSFKILLPVATLAESAPDPGVQVKGRILLADDDTVVRQVTGDVLRKLGYEVREAVDGQDALERFQAAPETISLVILDLVMPRLDGYATSRAMRALRPHLPVIFISGYSQKEVPMPAEVQGRSAFLQKPFQISKLEELLAEVLRSPDPEPRKPAPA